MNKEEKMTFKKDLSLQKAAQRDAESAIKFAKDHFKIELDWSDESIEKVEMILDALHKHALKDKPTEEQIFGFSRPFGSYIGEVYRRNHGAEWGMNYLEGESYPGLQCSKSGIQFWPWGKTNNRIIEGEEHNVWHYYQLLRDGRMSQKSNLNCECFTMPNITVTDMGSEHEDRIFETLREIKRYGEERWWLALYGCKNCNQYWLVAQESRQNDIHILKRLEKSEAEKIISSNEWPKQFVTLEELLAIGRDHNRSLEFIDPLDSSLASSIEDLRKARPSISNAEIASLLNINEKYVFQHWGIKTTTSNKPWWKFW